MFDAHALEPVRGSCDTEEHTSECLWGTAKCPALL